MDLLGVKACLGLLVLCFLHSCPGPGPGPGPSVPPLPLILSHFDFAASAVLFRWPCSS